MLLWNKNKTKLVESRRIRSYTILEQGQTWGVIGYFNGGEGFSFGVFETNVEAFRFLSSIYEMLKQ